jgi:hypothetical protein
LNTDVKNLVRKIQRQAQNRHDEIEPATAIRLEGNKFTFKSQVIKVTSIAKVQLCSLANLPMRVFEKLSSEQRSASFNELYEKLGDKHLMYRFGNGDLLIGVVSPNYTRIDNSVMIDVLRRASNTLKLVPVKAVITPEFSFIRMMPKNVSLKLHEFVPALTINNSEIGLAAFSIKSSLVVLKCLNGLILEENKQQWRWLHYGSNTEVKPDLSEIMNVANQHVRYLDNTRGRYLSIEEKVHFANKIKHDLGMKVGTAFVEAANRDYDGGRDMFCVVNALTSVAKSFSPIKQVEIEAFAGRLLLRAA